MTVAAASVSKQMYTAPQRREAPVPRTQVRIHPTDPPRVLYNRQWFGLAALGVGVGLAGLRHFGPGFGAAASVPALAALGYMRYVEPRRPVLERHDIRLARLPRSLDGLRIGQISDLHLGMPDSLANACWAVQQMNQHRPDIVVLNGDMVGSFGGLADLPVVLRDLHAPLGVYAVPGNHDYDEGIEDVRGMLDMLGIPLLLNQHVRLSLRSADLWLAGTDDLWDGSYDASKALRGIPDDACVILLSHEPDSADEAARHGVALQLSGHTHAGHFRLPVIGPFSWPRYGVTYVAGHYTVGDMALYVSRGLGGMPLRLLAQPEAAILTLRCAS